MTPNMKIVPAPAATGVEDNKSIAERSVTTAYLSRWGHNTRDTFGTWEGVKIPKEDFIPVLVPVHVAQEMVAYGPQLVELNKACAKEQSAAVRAEQEKDRQFRLKSELDFARRAAEADIVYAVDLLDILNAGDWTDEHEHDAIEFLEELLDRDITKVTAGLLTEARLVRRERRNAEFDAILARDGVS